MRKGPERVLRDRSAGLYPPPLPKPSLFYPLPDGGDKGGRERVVRIPQEQTGLSHPRVPYHQQLDLHVERVFLSSHLCTPSS